MLNKEDENREFFIEKRLDNLSNLRKNKSLLESVLRQKKSVGSFPEKARIH